MKPTPDDFHAIRDALASIPGDASSDAVGANVAKLGDIYAPESHAAALDPAIPIVLGSRGTGKSFWASVLGQADTRQAAARAYPRLNLDRVLVSFGFTGVGGPDGIGIDAVSACVPTVAGREQAKGFWWATILRAASRVAGDDPAAKLSSFLSAAADWETRDEILADHERRLQGEGKTLLIVYDALDRMATEWTRRRLLTEALLDVAWEMRAFRAIRIKLFFRPDQLEDDALRFVELPKLRTGAVRLEWSQVDLYGLVFSRLALARDPAREAFGRILLYRSIQVGNQDDVITRRWLLNRNKEQQEQVMADLAGPYMASGRFGFKKGKTYSWAFKHLADAFKEVTPRSFLGLMIAAANYGFPPDNRVITPEGMEHGLRAASKTRVDQLHQDFAWIKGVLAPLAGLLLPQEEERVFSAWKSAGTIAAVVEDARAKKYLPPFPPKDEPRESDLYLALERIGVMERRNDGRIDMPDLFRVAAKLLKKGGTAPLK